MQKKHILFLKLLIIFHKLLVYFMMFGFLLPRKYLFYHLITFPLIILHWIFNEEKCFLTELEYKLKGLKDAPVYTKDHNYPFMKRVYADFGFHPTNEQMHSIVMISLFGSWLITFYRMYIY